MQLGPAGNSAMYGLPVFSLCLPVSRVRMTWLFLTDHPNLLKRKPYKVHKFLFILWESLLCTGQNRKIILNIKFGHFIYLYLLIQQDTKTIAWELGATPAALTHKQHAHSLSHIHTHVSHTHTCTHTTCTYIYTPTKEAVFHLKTWPSSKPKFSGD